MSLLWDEEDTKKDDIKVLKTFAAATDPDFVVRSVEDTSEGLVLLEQNVKDLIVVDANLLSVAQTIDNVMKYNPGRETLNDKSSLTWEEIYNISDRSYKSVIRFRTSVNELASLVTDTAIAMWSCAEAIRGVQDSVAKEIVSEQLKHFVIRSKRLNQESKDLVIVSDEQLTVATNLVKDLAGQEACKCMTDRQADFDKLADLEEAARKKQSEVIRITADITELITVKTFMTSKLECKSKAVECAKQQEAALKASLEAGRGQMDDVALEKSVTNHVDRHIWFFSWNEKVCASVADPDAKSKIEAIKCALKAKEEALSATLTESDKLEKIIEEFEKQTAKIQNEIDSKQAELQLYLAEIASWKESYYNKRRRELLDSIAKTTSNLQEMLAKTDVHCSRLVDFTEALAAMKRSTMTSAGSTNLLQKALSAYASMFQPFVTALQSFNSAIEIESYLRRIAGPIQKCQPLIELRSAMVKTLPN
eukprot:TRINITY_DN6049_c0_g2_i1.p1 TRINITY_DN6049_c0_g2~~TRINITY_DN6049_c0_g2_i1.p1  ORF type:complete len:478 (+),score=127.84 TRINITY_DN6049_c0_g2_i1:116-1549(+)